MNKLSSLLFVSLVPFILRAQPPPVVETSPAGNHQQFELQVLRPTALKELMATLCSAAAARCEIDETALRDVVAPSVLRGTWSDLVRLLLEGTEANYIAAEMLDGLPILAVQARANLPESSQTFQPRTPNLQPDADEGTELALPARDAVPVPAAEAVPNSNVKIDIAAAFAADAQSGSDALMHATRDTPATYLPFTGNNVGLSDNTAATGSPFPYGRLGPSAADDVHGSPFPDSHGRLNPTKPAIPGSPFPAR